MKNPHASDGIAEDMIRSFVQIGCAETHAKTLLEKANAELTNGTIDVFDDELVMKKQEEISDLIEEINALAELRRNVMRELFEMYYGDKNYWCMVKHLGIAAYTMFEAYQASNDDPALLNDALNANKRFVKALTHFLGTEITDCAACFADFLKAKGE